MKNIMLIDGRYEKIAKKHWGERFTVLPSFCSPSLDVPTSYHPDMVLFRADEKTYICSPCAFDYYNKLLSPYGISVIEGEKSLKSNYPDDIAYNVLTIGNFAIAKFSQTDITIINHLKKQGFTMVDIPQGYAKCSACSFGLSTITADKSIEKALKKCSLPVLLIAEGEILLSGYDYGFIGGASGFFENKELFFFGDITKHSSYREILEFVHSQNISISYIDEIPLTDVGTIMFL